MYSIELPLSPVSPMPPLGGHPPRPVRLLDHLSERLREAGYSIKTERTYVHWVRRFLRWHGTHRPAELGTREVEAFLTYLIAEHRLPLSIYEQALSAILFLYKEILGADLHWPPPTTRSQPVPAVLTEAEVQMLLAALPPASALLACLLHSTGMRLTEALRLRVKDVDFAHGVIIVRDSKQMRSLRNVADHGHKNNRQGTRAHQKNFSRHDRLLTLPRALENALREQLAHSRQIWETDRLAGRTGVSMPGALAEEYPHAGETWTWHWAFPALTKDGHINTRVGRPAADAQTFLRHLKQAAKTAGITKPVNAQTLRHAHAMQLLSSGTAIRSVRELLGHTEMGAMMSYLHVLATTHSAPHKLTEVAAPQTTRLARHRASCHWPSGTVLPLPLHPPRQTAITSTAFALSTGR